MPLSPSSTTHVLSLRLSLFCYSILKVLLFYRQGLNYIVLYPVIQFLIKKVIETREETGDLLRMYSESQFGKTYKMPEDIDFEKRKPVL